MALLQLMEQKDFFCNGFKDEEIKDAIQKNFFIILYSWEVGLVCSPKMKLR